MKELKEPRDRRTRAELLSALRIAETCRRQAEEIAVKADGLKERVDALEDQTGALREQARDRDQWREEARRLRRENDDLRTYVRDLELAQAHIRGRLRAITPDPAPIASENKMSVPHEFSDPLDGDGRVVVVPSTLAAKRADSPWDSVRKGWWERG